MSISLESIEQKTGEHRRLSYEEGLFLFEPDVDLHRVGQLADKVRQSRHGRRAYYNRNAHLNPTNVCIFRCELCAYSRDLADPDAQVIDFPAMLDLAAEAVEDGCTELHIVGGLHPDKDFAWYKKIVQTIHDAYPSLHLKAFSAIEIAHFADIENRPVEAILEELIAAGLGSLPGGGAEILAPDVRQKICSTKHSGEIWLQVHETAHQLGLRSNATMLYGHVETVADRVDHLLQIRALQDKTGGFQAFVPLSFHPESTKLANIERCSSLTDLRTIAVSRLLLDNIDHIKAYWISLGIGTAQVALAYGADDLDGTVREEKIHHEAGSTAPESLSVEQLCELIRETGCEPIERDTLYRPIDAS
jgi:aminodeoxyfutalosine synthase